MTRGKKIGGPLMLAALLLLSLLLSACADDSTRTTTGGASTVKLRLALDWVPNTNHTGIYVAQQQGLYKQQGIELEILPYSEATLPEVLLTSGKADLAISSAESLTVAAAASQPIVSVAAILQKDTSALVTLKDSGLTSPKTLEGKRYAGFGAPYEDAVIGKMIKTDGGATGKVQNITTNTFGMEAVYSKQADFVWIFRGWDGIDAQLKGFQLNYMPPTAFGVPERYTPVIASTSDLIKSKADALRRFMKATAQGYDFAIIKPREAADLLIAANPAGTFSNKELVYKSQDYLSSRYKEGVSQWGSQTLQAWTDYPKFLYQNGILLNDKNQPLAQELDYNKLFTNELLPKP